ncbi:OmpA family protein [Lacinutrix sp. Hel_I_90]|uniref:OmpA family protein n=1 Tax=Lacinutrix sp. Hel_I_90 TaxID=1249999 RepID=UPI0006961A24|nr:OmpA family protein [Lacinutrix sp. Hel_I_90]
MKNLSYLLVFICTLNIAFASDHLKKDKLENTTTVVSHDVFFDTDKYQITTEEFSRLLAFIKASEKLDIKRITIIGYCDDRGSNEYNKTLSNKRANVIRVIIANYRNSLKKPEVVNTIGKGEIILSTSETSLFNELRSLNRKVTVVMAPKKLIADSFYGEDLRKGDLINLKKLNFERGLRYLTPESTETLKELANYLTKRTDLFFTINGHVCCTKNGRESRDKETGKINLSLVRAKYIRDYLVKAGVDAKRIRYQGLKGYYNLGGEASEDRRVELLIRHISE